MNDGDPSCYWPKIYSQDNIKIVASPDNCYYFFEGVRQFLFNAKKEALYKIANSRNSESYRLLQNILNNFSPKKIYIRKIIQVIKDANWKKVFD